MAAEVHWHEGLFLQPHHLQAMSRAHGEAIAGLRAQLMPHPWGVVDARLSRDALENMLVRFDRLHVIMPSGVELRVPEEAALPTLEIKRAFESTSDPITISLAVPLWDPNRANTVENDGTEPWRIKRLYRLTESDRPDENTGENPHPVVLRSVNARLVLDGEDTSDMEVLPLLRIVHATGEETGAPKQDPEFVPPCMTLSGSVVLRDMVRDLSNQVSAARQALVVQMTRGGFSIETMRGMQLEQVMRLRTLNRYAAGLATLAELPSMTPLAMYLALREMLGELAALNPGNDVFDVPRYDHHEPLAAFAAINEKLRSLLGGAVSEPWLRVGFEADGNGLIAALEDRHLADPTQYFLAVQTRQDPQAVAALVEDADRFKLMPAALAGRAIYGVKLQEERHPPLGLPSRADLHYFRLLREESARMWERILADKAVAAVWPDQENSDFQLSLYMTLAPENA
ncbi:MAG: type VI secretion system baseplate subunit TssK [Phycisphaeraceae bacterium]